MRQLRLPLPMRGWGGKRGGAGRPRGDGTTTGKRHPHLTRPLLAARHPVHATWRMARGVWNLRSRRAWKALAPALYGATRPGFAVVHFAILGNHVHLLVEADNRVRLARGMQGLGVRLAVRLNRMMNERRGRVVGDRYHARALRTPTEVRRARGYLLGNAARHYGTEGPDPYASVQPVTPPRTWLLRLHC